ncbi:EF-hand calcium-binding domain-containing 7-like isoform X5 [Brachionus plicatilis]|uniref:EF-hand calcium-binding domain-containing 7-like isoform X5 n=1 Tax=Brachionus plicatilis TaxID=10195 RepID=A0A3M7QJD7_BRAPC|nr:EF-hand calcium-binding domain-containing 7-like isoform X5 [Brachionus plicatilis]
MYKTPNYRLHSKMENEFEFRINENLVNEKKLLLPKNYKKWFSKSTKGGFYFNQNINGIIANSFALDLKHKSTLFFTIEEFKTKLHSIYELENMDVSILVIKDDEILSVKSFTETKIENKCCAKVDLASGRYFLFPFTTGCHLKKRQSDYTRTKVELFKQDLKGKMSLSKKFRDALDVVFDLVDLDSNGKLSQDEFNLYSFITSNEDIPDNEWKFLGELVGLKKNELTKESFIELHVIEANREDTDLTDIMSRLTNLGFNKSLTIDQVFLSKIMRRVIFKYY